MPKIDVTIESSRIGTVEIIERLYASRRFPFLKDAVRYFYNLARRKHQPTGFRMDTTFEHFYARFRAFYWGDKKNQKEHEQSSQSFAV